MHDIKISFILTHLFPTQKKVFPLRHAYKLDLGKELNEPQAPSFCLSEKKPKVLEERNQ